MPSYTGNSGYRTPFGGKNVYLGSTVGMRFDHGTVAKSTVHTESIDSVDQKVLQAGELLARIRTGADAGKLGPYQVTATDGRQSTSAIVGFNDTYLPWQLNERDVEVGYVYTAAVTQERCTERDVNGLRVPLTDATRVLLATQLPSIVWRRASTDL